jgi:hypothetical protein
LLLENQIRNKEVAVPRHIIIFYLKKLFFL